MQLVDPASAAYVRPEEHVVHAEVPVVRELYEPALQLVHTEGDAAAATEPYAPAEHAVHSDVPVVSAL